MCGRLAAAVLLAMASLAGCRDARGLRVDVRPGPDHQAWWMRTDIAPFATRVRGIPAQQLDRAWCRASALSEAAFPDSVRHGTQGLDAHFARGRRGFSAEGSFGGRPLEVVLGIFESCRGESGNFLLVLEADRPVSASDAVLQVEQISSRPVLMHMAVDPARGEIFVSSCFQCDEVGRWRWHSASGRFIRQPEPDPG
jgi:hypothetical protein